MRTQPFKINEEVLKEIEYLASNGMNGEDLVETLPISQSTFYKYKRLAKKYEDEILSDEEFAELPEKDQIAIQMVQSFKRGQLEYRKKELPYFANCSDPRIRWKLFQATFKAYRDKRQIDLEHLEGELRTEYGADLAHNVIKLIIESEDGYNEAESAVDTTSTT